MISPMCFRIGVPIQVPGVFPRPVQLFQASSLFLCSLGQFLSFHFQLEGSQRWYWWRRGWHSWKRWPRIDSHGKTFPISFSERGKTR